MRTSALVVLSALAVTAYSACSKSSDSKTNSVDTADEKSNQAGSSSRAGAGAAGGTPSRATGGGGAQPPERSSATGAGVAMTYASTCKPPEPPAKVGNDCLGSPPPRLKLTEIATGLLSPTFAAHAPGDPSRLYVLEQRGTVRVVKEGELVEEPLIDLRDLSGSPVNNSTIIPGSYGEGGLLGAVFDPRFEETKRFWLSYTKPGPAFTVVQFTLDDPDKVDVTKYSELLSFPQYGFFPGGQGTNHIGSMLAFGPDGCMYVSRGDGGGESDRQMSGQKTTDDLCSILRIDVDTYPEPAPGNLEGHVWNFGFRNPWRYSFDRETGDLYIGDVGQDVNTGFEEINVEPRARGGRNYGWSISEGVTCHSGQDCSKVTKPALQYGITATQNSVIGGYVYRGKKIPGLVGRYIWADWSERIIKTFVYKGETDGVPEICDAADTSITVPSKVRSFGEDLDGELYVVAGGPPSGNFSSAGLSEPGTIYRIDADDTSDEPAPGTGAAGASANAGKGTPAAGRGGSAGSAAAGDTGAPTFSAIYTEILTKGATGNCMFGACHGGSADAMANGGLQIRAGDQAGTYKNLVNAKSTSAVCKDKTYVVPGDSKASLLIQKLSDNPPCGDKMPIGAPLTAAQIEQIASWIDQGARDD